MEAEGGRGWGRVERGVGMGGHGGLWGCQDK